MVSAAPDISVVIPIYNESDNLPELDRRLHAALGSTGRSYEIVLVNDGSSDASPELMRKLREADERVKLIDFSRNFGHQAAISAGIDHATGRAVIVMDGDLQDPPEVLPGLIERWEQGYDVVYAVRKNRPEGIFKRAAYAGFYRLLQWVSDTDIPLDSGDFSLMDRKVADLLVGLPERNRFVRGLRAWLGFRQTGYEYDRGERFAGKPKYDLRGLMKLALDGIFSFSEFPLRVATRLGLAITAAAALLAFATLLTRIFNYQVVPGFAAIAILVLFFGGVQLAAVGILGEYIARIYTEVKGRPNYVVRELHGLAARAPAPPRGAASGAGEGPR